VPGAALDAAVTVLADPHFSITPAERAKRTAAIMAAYSLQQQMIPAREGLQSVAAALRSGPGFPRETTERMEARAAAVERQINASVAAAGRVQSAMDAFSGVPTAAQLRDLDFAWEDAATAVAALNRLMSQELPAAYAEVGTAKMPAIRPVPTPVRKH
jgi:hypothetical protein